MKKAFLLSAVAIAGSVLATDVETANSYGVLPVTTSGTATMVAVPFVGDGANISIDQMVKATNLSAGDMIYALPTGSDNAYKVWQLNSGRTAWEPVVGVKVGTGTQFTPTSASQTTIARGQAFWLVRNSSSSTTFYVMGVGPTDVAGATTVSNGWNLVGQSSATGAKTLADIATAVGAKGSVRLNNGTRYTYTGSKWYSVSGNVPTEVLDPESTPLPVGEGFWIVRKAEGSENVSL